MQISIAAQNKYTLEEAVSNEQEVLFRKVIPLNFENPNQDEIVLYPEQSSFSVLAKSITENVLSDHPIVGEIQIQVKSKALWVSLPRPYPIHKLVLKNKTRKTAKGAGKGSGKSPESLSKTVKDSKNPMLSTVEMGFASSALRNIALYRIDGDALSESPTVTVGSGEQIEDFVSDHFAIVWMDNTGAAKNISLDTFSSIQIKSKPTGVKIGVAQEAQLNESDVFWLKAGEFNEITASDPVNEDAVKGFIEAIQRQMESSLQSLKLVLEADTPCEIRFSDFLISYFLKRLSHLKKTDNTETENPFRLDFSGEFYEEQKFSFELPTNISIEAASLNVEADFHSEDIYPNGLNPQLLDNSSTGIKLQAQQSIAHGINPLQSFKSKGIMLGLMALTDDAKITLEMREDWQQSPEGAILQSAEAEVTLVRGKHWKRIVFAESFSLFSSPHWLVLKVVEGELLWLLSDTENGGLEQSTIIKRNHSSDSITSSMIVTGNLKPTVGIIKSVPSSQQPDIDVIIAGQTVDAISDENEALLIYPIKQILQDELANNLNQIPLTFATAKSGSSKIAAIEIVYSPLD